MQLIRKPRSYSDRLAAAQQDLRLDISVSTPNFQKLCRQADTTILNAIRSVEATASSSRVTSIYVVLAHIARRAKA